MLTNCPKYVIIRQELEDYEKEKHHKSHKVSR